MNELCIVKVVGPRRVMEFNVTGEVILGFLIQHEAEMSKERRLEQVVRVLWVAAKYVPRDPGLEVVRRLTRRVRVAGAVLSLIHI